MDKIIKFIGKDKHGRKVFQGESGRLYCDVAMTHRFGGESEFYTKLNNDFDGEPDMPTPKEWNPQIIESKNKGKQLCRLTESDLHKIVKESAKRIMKEVALKGKSGKTHSLHGTDPESWAIMARLRGKNGYLPHTPQHYHACRDEDNWIELDDKAHPNLRSRNNAKRIDAMMNRIDDKSKDIMAANESKLSRIVKESVNRVLKEARSGEWNQYRLDDFVRDVLQGGVQGKGIIKTYTGEILRYKMKGRSLMIDFSQYNDGGPGWAREFVENEAQNYPEYQFSLDPNDMNKNRMIVRCSYDEEMGI